MKLLIVLVFYASLWMVCSSDSAPDSLAAVRQSNWEFTNSLYSAVRKESKPSHNIIFSPFSVQLILAMCYMGASGNTARETSKGLRLPNQPDLVKSGFQKSLKYMPTSQNVIVETANIIFPGKSFTVLQDFIDDVKEYFHSDIENVDYNLASKAAQTINDRVKEKTHGKILGIVNESALDPSTMMLLMNAVYFKGDWLIAFDKTLTSKETFYVNGNDEKHVDMMHCKTWLAHWKNTKLGAHMVEIPYKDNSTSLVIILPDQLTGLPSVEQKLEGMNLREVLAPIRPNHLTQVALSLPRFTIEENTQLNDALKSLGISEMFLPTANFARISSQSGLSVSQVMHAAMLEVNEEGTVAAAATTTQFSGRSFVRTDTYVVNHPFAFALMSRSLDMVLFMGRYTGKTGNLARFVQVQIPKSRHIAGGGKNGVAPRLAAWSYLWINILCILGCVYV